MYYVRVGNRMMSVEDYKNLTDQKIEQFKQDAINTANKRKEAIEKAMNPKKKDGTTFDVRPEALAKARAEAEAALMAETAVEATADPVEVNAPTSELVVETEETSETEKKKGGRPKKVVIEAEV